MTEGVELVGVEDVQGVLDRLADAAGNLEEPHRTVGEQLLDLADPRTPRRSGALAASGRVDAASNETDLIYDEVYSGPIHNGWYAHNIAPQPWLLDTVNESHDLVLSGFHDYIAEAI